ncbi:TPA: thioredoxin domain-containing protein [Escherichia coli]|uniref:DsbA family protein n=1 Tax=Escherichia coli TaxID=562 RepID=UPI000530691B|nr:DsbA family protein [Escherichia coli]HBA7292984.1 thioredoxin domain-containing protein [Escherichia coli]HBA8028804.1 thioredoxin domain-containing protein [Escherichia coli]HBA8043433.1 thioredoxin domain-containing protein [Escherichia coli]HBA8936777.1 thioredoxin domain-containing protein [Escherichia coli]HBA8978629.1 thioredoxin domain-containing protein [Escherichia coli]
MRKSRLISLFLCMVLSGPVYAQDRATYSLLNKPVESAVQDNETVVEFFSFYCPPCYAFSQDYGIDKAIRESLPSGKKMVKYHTGFLGELGEELTRAWSVAMVLGVEDKVEPLLFDAVQKTRRLRSASDIPGIFIRAGVYPGEYSKALASKAVAELTEKQKRLFREYGVTGTPSVFINGKYRIENNAFHADSVDAFRESYVAAVKSLLNMTNN